MDNQLPKMNLQKGLNCMPPILLLILIIISTCPIAWGIASYEFNNSLAISNSSSHTTSKSRLGFLGILGVICFAIGAYLPSISLWDFNISYFDYLYSQNKILLVALSFCLIVNIIFFALSNYLAALLESIICIVMFFCDFYFVITDTLTPFSSFSSSLSGKFNLPVDLVFEILGPGIWFMLAGFLLMLTFSIVPFAITKRPISS